MPKLDHPYSFTFTPLAQLEMDEANHLEALLKADGSSIIFPGLRAYRGNARWFVQLPPGTWANSFAFGTVSPEADTRGWEGTLSGLKPRKFAQRDFYISETNEIFVTKRVLARVVEVYSAMYMVKAMLRFLEAIGASKTNDLMVPDWSGAFSYNVPTINELDKRPWTDVEDSVIRRWFSLRAVGPSAGKHVPLTPDEWQIVLEALGYSRTKKGVRRRVYELNRLLYTSLYKEQTSKMGHPDWPGLVGHYKEQYDRCVLGERPRAVQTPADTRRKFIAAEKARRFLARQARLARRAQKLQEAMEAEVAPAVGRVVCASLSDA